MNYESWGQMYNMVAMSCDIDNAMIPITKMYKSCIFSFIENHYYYYCCYHNIIAVLIFCHVHMYHYQDLQVGTDNVMYLIHTKVKVRNRHINYIYQMYMLTQHTHAHHNTTQQHWDMNKVVLLQ